MTGPALRIVNDKNIDMRVSFAAMAKRRTQVANLLRTRRVMPGDRILVSLGNCMELWESMLAVIKLGAVMIPASTLLCRDELQQRMQRGRVKCVITHAHLTDCFAGFAKSGVRIAVGDSIPGWVNYAETTCAKESLTSQPVVRADSPLFLDFTSGTTSQPKLVEHSHTSYPG